MMILFPASAVPNDDRAVARRFARFHRPARCLAAVLAATLTLVAVAIPVAGQVPDAGRVPPARPAPTTERAPTAGVATGTGSAQSGFYLAGEGQFLVVHGTGTWSGYDFDVRQPLMVEEGDPVGLSWSENFLLGVKPTIGFRFGRSWAVQLGYGFNLPKSTQQAYYQTSSTTYREQGMLARWRQSNLELVAVFYPGRSRQWHVFGGLDLTQAKAELTWFEGTTVSDGLGHTATDYSYTENADDILAKGFTIGLGYDIGDGTSRTGGYVTLQYTRTLTDGAFLGSEGFDVDLGGITLRAGVRWFPFLN